MNLPASDNKPSASSGADGDAHAPASFAGFDERVDAEAASWAARRRDGLDAAGRAALQAWLDRDPRHAAALQDMDTTLAHVRALPAADVAALRGRTDPPAALSRRAAPGSRPSRLAGWSRRIPQAAMAVLLALAVGGGWLGWDAWQRQPVFVQAFATERGQQRTLRLPDDAAAGSLLQLDTGTRIEARLYRNLREVVLADGQAMFNVHADAARPFHVRVGGLRVSVVGTRFSVRHTASGVAAGSTVVSVEEGHVRVSRLDADTPAGRVPADAADAVDLTAGRMLVADGSGRLGPVTQVAPSAIAPWRSGRISFEGTPLAQALAEFERYGRTGLVVRDPAVAALSVGGSYDLRQFQQFARALPDVLPVRLERRGDLTEIVAR